MNKKPIDQARDSDIRLSGIAMRRAAASARELALKTGTLLVVKEQGELRHISPETGKAVKVTKVSAKR